MTGDRGQMDAMRIARTMVTKLQTAEDLIYNREPVDVLVGPEEDAPAVCEALEEANGCYGPDAAPEPNVEPVPAPDIEVVRKPDAARYARASKGGGGKFDGRAFKDYLRERCVNVTMLAERAGVSHLTLRKWAGGEIDHPSIQSMKKVADALGVSLNWFQENFMTGAD